jgi:hypothetical protein
MKSNPDRNILDKVFTVLRGNLKRPAPPLELRQHASSRLLGECQAIVIGSIRDDPVVDDTAAHPSPLPFRF